MVSGQVRGFRPDERTFRGRPGKTVPMSGRGLGSRALQTFFPGTVVEYGQKAGEWTLEGNMTLECLPTGEWSAPNPFPLPTCKKYCTQLPPISNGQCSWDDGENKVEWRNRIDCRCNTGYRFKRFRKATCSNAEEWSNLPECVPIRVQTTEAPKCRRIPEIDFGRCEPLGNNTAPFDRGDHVRCMCEPGYALSERFLILTLVMTVPAMIPQMKFHAMILLNALVWMASN